MDTRVCKKCGTSRASGYPYRCKECRRQEHRQRREDIKLGKLRVSPLVKVVDPPFIPTSSLEEDAIGFSSLAGMICTQAVQDWCYISSPSSGYRITASGFIFDESYKLNWGELTIAPRALFEACNIDLDVLREKLSSIQNTQYQDVRYWRRIVSRKKKTSVE